MAEARQDPEPFAFPERTAQIGVGATTPFLIEKGQAVCGFNDERRARKELHRVERPFRPPKTGAILPAPSLSGVAARLDSGVIILEVVSSASHLHLPDWCQNSGIAFDALRFIRLHVRRRFVAVLGVTRLYL